MFYKEKHKKNDKDSETIRYSFVENYSDFCSYDNGDFFLIGFGNIDEAYSAFEEKTSFIVLVIFK